MGEEVVGKAGPQGGMRHRRRAPCMTTSWPSSKTAPCSSLSCRTNNIARNPFLAPRPERVAHDSERDLTARHQNRSWTSHLG